MVHCIKTKLSSILEEIEFPETKNLQHRGIADKVEAACNDIIVSKFENACLARSRRSIEDISIGDVYVDHKTCDVALDFKMPNLISIKRLRDLDRPLLYNFMIYNSQEKRFISQFCLYVHELNWDHLHIQNLGEGQLQIANMKDFLDSPMSELTKDEWYELLSLKACAFYESLIVKTQRRLKSWRDYNSAMNSSSP
jgi:hypothetical protein